MKNIKESAASDPMMLVQLFLEFSRAMDMFNLAPSKNLDLDFNLNLEDLCCMLEKEGSGEEKKQDACKKYLQFLKEGKQIFDTCLLPSLSSLSICNDSLKPEEQNYLITIFKVLKEYIVIDCDKYEKAFNECDVFTMFTIARKQFELLDRKKPYFHIIAKCRMEYSTGGAKGSRICGLDNILQLPQNKQSVGCVIPSFCADPAQLIECPVEIDKECFMFILKQFKDHYYQQSINFQCIQKLAKLFENCCKLQTPAAIMRIKLCIIILITDIRIGMLDFSFEKYCLPLVCDSQNGRFKYNIDPVLKCCFGSATQ